MVGKDLGLATDQIEELQHWESLFNYEVHGSRFTFLQTGAWIFEFNEAIFDRTSTE